jgi:hypothetical protein
MVRPSDLGAALARDLAHDLGLDAVAAQHICGARRGQDGEAEVDSRRLTGKMHGPLVAVGHRDEHRARVGQPAVSRRAGSWRRPVPKSVSMPMTSPVERISGPSRASTTSPSAVRNRLNGSTASLTDIGAWAGRVPPSPCAAGSSPSSRSCGDGRAEHDPGGRLGERHPGRLGDERHGARGARVGLEHVEDVLRQGELDVHQPAHPDALGELAGRGRAPARALGAPRVTGGRVQACRRSGCRPPRCAP